jgi:hypothetical protein
LFFMLLQCCTSVFATVNLLLFSVFAKELPSA